MSAPEPKATVSFDPRVVLRPRTLDETFDLTFAYLRVYGRDFRRVFLMSLVVGLVVSAVLRWWLDQSWFVVWAVLFVITPVIEKIVLVFGGDHLFENDPKLRRGLRRTFRRFVPALIGSLLVPLPWLPMLLTQMQEEAWIGTGILLFTIWPFGVAWFMYLSSVYLLEGVPVRSAHRRSSTLITYRFGRAISFVAVGFLIRLLFVYTAEVGAHFVVSFVLQLGEPMDTLLTHFGSFAAVSGFMVAAPIIALARMFDYVDARTRLEGWDLQVRFKGLASKKRGTARGRAAA